MRRAPTFATAIASLVALGMLAPALADHCEGYSTSEPEVTAGALYVENDLCQLCTWSIWVYEESNGIDGLQREDEIVDDTCHGAIRGDTIVF